MNPLAKLAVERGLALNRRLSRSAANSVDWLFKRDTLIQSGRTWFELVHDGDLMAVRYYELPEEDEIELATEEINEVFAPTGLANPIIFNVSAHSGAGIDELRDHLLERSRTLPPRQVKNKVSSNSKSPT